MTPQEFINKWNGRKIDIDGYPDYQPYQCTDLAEKYNQEVVGAPRIGGNGQDFWGRASYSFYQRVPNTLTSVPIKGDLVVWRGWNTNPYGHVAMADGSGNYLWFYSYDQEWGGIPMHRQFHNYTNVIGYLRPYRLTAPAPTPVPYFTVRCDKPICMVRTKPNSTAPLGGMKQHIRGERFNVVGTIVGENVSGNSIWYKTTGGNYVWSGGITRI